MWGISPVTGEFPSQRPVTRSFDVLFDLRLNKRLSKQSRRRWFENLRLPDLHLNSRLLLMTIRSQESNSGNGHRGRYAPLFRNYCCLCVFDGPGRLVPFRRALRSLRPQCTRNYAFVEMTWIKSGRSNTKKQDMFDPDMSNKSYH